MTEDFDVEMLAKERELLRRMRERDIRDQEEEDWGLYPKLGEDAVDALEGLLLHPGWGIFAERVHLMAKIEVLKAIGRDGTEFSRGLACAYVYLPNLPELLLLEAKAKSKRELETEVGRVDTGIQDRHLPALRTRRKKRS